jgi:hypothetical protein
MFPPVRIRRLHGICAEPRTGFLDRLAATEVEDQKRLGVRLRRLVTGAARELEVCTRPRERQEDAVIPVVIREAADVRKAQPVAVKTDDLVEPFRVARRSGPGAFARRSTA